MLACKFFLNRFSFAILGQESFHCNYVTIFMAALEELKLHYSDFAVIFLSLGSILFVGIRKGFGIKTMREYTVGNKNFSTLFLTCTLCATIIGGQAIIGRTEQMYKVGNAYTIASLGYFFSIFAVGYFFGPKMIHLGEEISVGEVIGKKYGNSGRIVTGFLGFIYCAGAIAAEIAAIGYIFHLFTKLPYEIGILLGFGIVITYSSFGGIRAVTFTDVLQFIFIAATIPALSEGLMKDDNLIFDLIASVKKTHPVHVNPFLDPELIKKYLSLFFLFCIPSLNPAKFQRLLMARGGQAKEVFINTAYICFVFVLFMSIVGLGAIKLAPNIEPNLVFPYLVQKAIPPFFKGVAIAGVLAAIMSTSDSYLNSGSVSLVHDGLKPLVGKGWSEEKELALTRICSVLMGIFGVVMATKFKNLISILLAVKAFWMPLIVPPLIGVLIGYKAKKHVFWLSMFGGLVCLLTWHIFITPKCGVVALLPATLFNALILFGPSLMLKAIMQGLTFPLRLFLRRI